MNQSPNSYIENSIIILESIDANEVINTAKGPNMLKSFINQATSFILGRKYDKKSELEKEIKKCDRVLEDIREERKVAKDKNKNESYKFTLNYIYSISKNIFSLFIAPVMIEKTIKIPSGISNLFKLSSGTGKISKSASFIKDISNNKAIKAVSTTKSAVDIGIPSDISKLYLSFKDYDRLLENYENQISNIKYNLESQLKNIKEIKEYASMTNFILEEDVISNAAVKVNYISPEELQGKPLRHDSPEMVNNNIETRDVIHDEVEKPVEDPKPELPPQKPEFSPLDAIEKAKAEPSNIVIVKHNNDHYIKYSDLKDYMGAAKINNYDNAVDNIVKVHNDPEIKNNLSVIMGSTDLENCSEEEKRQMQESLVDFRVY